MNKVMIEKLKPKKIEFGKLKLKGKLTKKKVFILIILLIVGGIIFKTIKPAPPVQAKSTVLEKTNMVNSINVLGEVKSEDSVNVYTTLTSPIKEIKVKLGDKVKAGDVLAILDSENLEKDLAKLVEETNAAEANAKIDFESKKKAYDNAIYIDNNNLNQTLNDAEALIKSTKLELDNKEKIYEYNKVMFNNGDISEQDLKKAEIDYENAKSSYDKSIVDLENAKIKVANDIDNAKSNFEAAKITYENKSQRMALEKQQKELEDCEVKAPIDGVVTSMNAAVGSVANGTLFTIDDLDNIAVTMSIKEVDVANVKVGQKAEIKTDATGENAIEGEVLSVSPTAKKEQKPDSKNGETSFEAKVKLNTADDGIKVGMTARTNLILEEKSDVYAVAYESLVEEDGKKNIYIAEKQDDKYIVKQIPVTVGMETDFNVEITGEDLSDGLIVISEPSNYQIGSFVEIEGR